VKEQKLEGEYRYVNSRIITNSEEVAFYQGNKKEKTIIMATFRKLVSQAVKCIQTCPKERYTDVASNGSSPVTDQN